MIFVKEHVAEHVVAVVPAHFKGFLAVDCFLEKVGPVF
jgi:hypothetical protein